MTDSERREIERAYKDAAAKVAALPDRLKDEEQQAEAENREPLPIQPLTGIAAALLIAAIDEINEPDAVASSQRRSCEALGNARVFLLSEHLKTILEAAGFGPKDKVNAPL